MKSELPSRRIAVLIDGGFFIKRFNHLYNSDGRMSGEQVADAMYTMAHRHLRANDVLYRVFYYDCAPMSKKMHNPVTKKAIDFSKTEQYRFRMELMECLKHKRKVALRLGTLKEDGTWMIRPRVVKDLLKGKTTIADLKEDDVYLEVRQKGIDMKIGVDIASLSLKRFVDVIVLFSGDSDFVPAAKLARREGIDFVLDPMHANVESQLFEHIDGLKSVDPHETPVRPVKPKKSIVKPSPARRIIRKKEIR